jgi:hypothetical protein
VLIRGPAHHVTEAERAAALAVVVVDLVAVRPGLDDNVVQAGAVAVVAAEAVAAGHAAAGLKQRRRRVQAAGHLVEHAGPAGGFQLRPHGCRGVGVVPASSASVTSMSCAGIRSRVRRYTTTASAVHHDRFGGAEPARGARGVHGGIPATVDGDPAAEHGRRAVLDKVQHRYRVHDPGRVPGRDVGALADVGADGYESGVEAAARRRVAVGRFGELGEDAGHRGVEFERDAHLQDAVDLGVQDVTRQPVLRDAVAHHAAGLRARILDGYRVAHAGEVVGR